MSGITYAQAPLDLTQSLQSVRDANKDIWNLHTIPQWLTEGNLYNRGYALAQRNKSKSALDALSHVKTYLDTSCEGAVSLSQITQVFQYTDSGRKLYELTTSKNQTASLDDDTFADACVEVYLCVNKQSKLSVREKQRFYTLNTYEQCQRTIETIYRESQIRSFAYASLEDVNYGDDIFTNWDVDDAPFDLLYLTQEIGNTTFFDNNAFSSYQYYDTKPLSSYQQPDPTKIIEKDFSLPEKNPANPYAHLPATKNIFPEIPKNANPSILKQEQTFNPTLTLWSQARDQQKFPTPVALAQDTISRSQPAWSNWYWWLGNNICESPNIPNPKQRDFLQESIDLEQESKKYQTWLDLEARVSLEIFAGLMDPDIEGLPPAERNQIMQALWINNDLGTNVLNELNVDLDAWDMTAIKSQLQQCLNEAELDPEMRKKQIWNHVSKIHALAQCVQRNLCKWVHDPSNRGLYTIKFCKIPSKTYTVVGTNEVGSIEEIINEMRNIVHSLKESGQLIKHEKTKDGYMSSQVAGQLKLWEKFSFEISFLSKKSLSSKDPRAEKIEQEEQNIYLQKTILQMSDQLTQPTIKNKYLVMKNPAGSQWSIEQTWLLELENERIRKTQAYLDTMKASQAMQQSTLAQKTQTATIHDSFEDFLTQQIELRNVAHDHFDDINTKRATTLDKFQNGK